MKPERFDERVVIILPKEVKEMEKEEGFVPNGETKGIIGTYLGFDVYLSERMPND